VYNLFLYSTFIPIFLLISTSILVLGSIFIFSILKLTLLSEKHAPLSTVLLYFTVNNLLRLWIRFKNTLYDDESYLTHTLPVDRKTIYLSKIVVSMITMFTSILVIVLTLFIAYYSKENMETLKNMENEKSHCMTWNMVRNTEKRGKCEMHNL